MSNQYFSGSPSNMGQVHALPAQSFKELVADVIREPIPLQLDRYDLHCLPEDEQGEAKKTDYLTPAVFKNNLRKTENATCCNLIFVDIDDPVEAQRILDRTPAALLGDLPAVVYHTARSLPSAPRLRVMVAANEVPVAHYPAAVKVIAGMLGMNQPNRESLIPVQAMYLPVSFTDDTTDPVVYAKVEGKEYVHSAPIALPRGQPAPTQVDDEDIANIEHLREPMEGVTPELVDEALTKIDPDCRMQKWVEIGMGLKHQFGEPGFESWNRWSSEGEKYKGEQETRKRWDSFTGATKDRPPITLRSVIRAAEEGGWNPEELIEQRTQALAAWIESDARTVSDLKTKAIDRIACLGVASGAVRERLLHLLAAALKRRTGDKPQISILRKELKERLRTHCQEHPATLPLWSKDYVYVGGRYNEFYQLKNGYKSPTATFDVEHEKDLPGSGIKPHEYVLSECRLRQLQDYGYHPGENQFFNDERGLECVNTYQRSFAPADLSCLPQARKLLERHLGYLILEPEYRRMVMDFIAYLAQRPGEKILWAILLQGVEGCGKGTLADIIAAVLGKTNVRRLEAGDALDSQFNDFAVGSQVVVFDEVRNVGENRFRVMEKLKPLITDPFIEYNAKYLRQRNVRNVANYILFTNHLDAMPLSDDDRRFFTLKSPLQSKADLQKHDVTRSCEELHALLQEKPGAFRALFETWTISPNFQPTGRAPATPYKSEMSRAAESPLKAEVREALASGHPPFVQADLLSLHALAAVLPANQGIGRIPSQTVSNVVAELGYSRLGEFRIDGTKHRLWAKRGTKFEADHQLAVAEVRTRIDADQYIG